MTKLEEIARIVSDFTGQHQWDDMAVDRGQLREFVRQGGYDVNEPTKDDCLGAAHKILLALKTPAPEMIEAGQLACEWVKADETADIYRAMIDAAGGATTMSTEATIASCQKSSRCWSGKAMDAVDWDELRQSAISAWNRRTLTPDTIGSHFGNGGGLDPVAGDVIIGNFIAQYDEGAAGCLMDADDAQSLAREFKRMQGLIYCPGVLRCAKCDFRLIKTILTPAGAFANEEPDSCPNCDAPMWRVTWQDEAKDAYKTAESQMNRALEAERALVAHPPHPAPVDPVETLAQRQAREVMRPQSGSALAQPPFGQVYGMATKPVDPVAGGEALREGLTDADWDRAQAETDRLTRELDIANADHIALWLEANMADGPLAWLACRIVEAHEAALAALKGPAA